MLRQEAGFCGILTLSFAVEKQEGIVFFVIYKLSVTMETSSAPSKILERGPDYLRKQMELENETKVGLSAVERLARSKPKYVKSKKVISSTQEPVISIGSVSVSSNGSSNLKGKLVSNLPLTISSSSGPSVSPGEVRRSSSKKRPDSLLLYRQKCDLLKASGSDRRHHLLRKLQSKELIPTPEGRAQECTVSIVPLQEDQNGVAPKNNKENTNLLTVPNATEEFRRSGKGVSRSHSDISSRYSKNFADFDAFFKYCGLDGEVIESVGKENFSVHSEEIELHIRSVSVSNSDDGFSRSSGDSDGLQEDVVHRKFRQETSVIERNARIIKWLYSCRNATERGKKLRDLE